jgi:hypothetical protein
MTNVIHTEQQSANELQIFVERVMGSPITTACNTFAIAKKDRWDIGGGGEHHNDDTIVMVNHNQATLQHGDHFMHPLYNVLLQRSCPCCHL